MLSQAQVAEYMERSGDPTFLWTWDLHETEAGWFNWNREGNTLIVGNAQGDVRRLMVEMKALARAHHCDRVRWASRGHERAYKRLFDAQTVGYVFEVSAWAD